MFDGMTRGSNLWSNLGEHLAQRPDLHDQQLWRLAIDANFLKHTRLP